MRPIVLITGATSGIGKAAVKKFADQHFTIVATGRKIEELEKLQKEFGQITKIYIFQIDLTEANAVSNLVSYMSETTGKLDCLINAAGIIGSGTIEDTLLEDWRYMFKLNVDVVFELMQKAIPFLEKSDLKSIVNVSSVVGLRQFPGVLAYSVSKSAVDQLTKVSALELADKQIRVNAINPGVVETNLHKRGGMDDDTYDDFLEHSTTTHPLGRVGQPEEVAELIYFLASDQSQWITGQTVAIDGGRSLTCFR